MKIQIYVLNRALAGVGVALAVISSVIMLVDLVELSRSLGGRGDIGFVQLGRLTLLKSPAIILQLLPFVFLFGSMGAFVSLNRRSELIAMRAAGLSAWSFVLPGVVAAFAIGAVSVALLNPLAAGLNGRFEDERALLTEGGASEARGEVWLRQGANGSQIVIHARSHDTQDGHIRLKAVSIFIQSVGQSGTLDFARRIEADQALLLPGYWRLTRVKEARPGSESVRSEALSIPSTLDRRSAMEKFIAPGDVAFWDLPATIRSADLAGYSSASYRLRLQQLIATPALLAAMTMLAATFSLRLLRLGDLAALAGSGVALGFGVYFLNQFCGALGATNVLPVFVAAWAPPTLAILSSVTVLCYTEDG